MGREKKDLETNRRMKKKEYEDKERKIDMRLTKMIK